MNRVLSLFRRFTLNDLGSATVEFVIAVPIVLSMLFTAIDFGAVMLRQVFLDRSVSMAMREVRLGNVTSANIDDFRAAICSGTFLVPNCTSVMTIEMRPIPTDTFAGLTSSTQCVDRAASVSPVVDFNPGAGAQELMLLKVCVVVDPFIELTGMVLGMETDASGGYAIVSQAAFANEPA
ncbi:MAG: TadE/TadG family type IV pilus assembly protein [Paracoccaceae bacterium]